MSSKPIPLRRLETDRFRCSIRKILAKIKLAMFGQEGTLNGAASLRREAGSTKKTSFSHLSVGVLNDNLSAREDRPLNR